MYFGRKLQEIKVNFFHGKIFKKKGIIFTITQQSMVPIYPLFQLCSLHLTLDAFPLPPCTLAPSFETYVTPGFSIDIRNHSVLWGTPAPNTLGGVGFQRDWRGCSTGMKQRSEAQATGEVIITAVLSHGASGTIF